MESLDLGSTRELEDLIIEAFYANVVHGQLDQINKQVRLAVSSPTSEEGVNGRTSSYLVA